VARLALKVSFAVSEIRPKDAMERSKCFVKEGAAPVFSTISLQLIGVEDDVSVEKMLRSMPTWASDQRSGWYCVSR
jgi:hypothetical protein